MPDEKTHAWRIVRTGERAPQFVTECGIPVEVDWKKVGTPEGSEACNPPATVWPASNCPECRASLPKDRL